MTAISLPEKKKPSQVAHDETPWPMSACSLGSPSQRAEAPLAMMRVRVSRVSRPRLTSRGFLLPSASFAAEIEAYHVAGEELGAEARGLHAHVVDELGPLDAFGKAREIFHQGGDGELAAGLVAVDDQRGEVGTRGINGRGQAGAAGADDDDVTNVVWHRDSFDSAARRKMQGGAPSGILAKSCQPSAISRQLVPRTTHSPRIGLRRPWRM